jgi:hypothetical protein
MSNSDQPNKSEQNRRSFQDTLDRAEKVITDSRAAIARSQALGQFVADLDREIKQVRNEEDDASRAQKDEA